MMIHIVGEDKFNPLKIPGCILWLEADKGITLDGSNNVSAWADQGGNTRHCGQTTPARRPGYSLTVLNGCPGLIFNDASGLFLSKSGLTGLTSPSAMTVMAVHAPSGVTAGQNYYVFSFTGFGAALAYRTVSLYGFATGAKYGYATNTNTNPQITTLIFDGSGSTDGDKLKLYRNGSQLSMTFVGSPLPATLSTATAYYVGTNSSSSQQYTGAISLIIAYSRIITIPERNYLERGFGRKYKVTVA